MGCVSSFGQLGMIALLDNTVISNFSFIRRSDLVQIALGGAVATVQAAFTEYIRGVKLNRLPLCNWDWLPMIACGYRSPLRSLAELR